MQALLVVNSLQKMADLRFSIGEIVVLTDVDLLALQGLHEAFRLRIVIRITPAAHANLDAAALQQTRVLARRILNAAIRMTLDVK